MKKSFKVCLAIIGILLGIATISSIGFLISEVNLLSKRMERVDKFVMDELWDKAAREATREMGGMVDLSIPNIQDIGNGFMVSELSVEQHLTGVKIKGRIINSAALAHKNVKFRIEIAEQQKEFHITEISIGSSTSFNVYISDVPIDKTKFAKIEYVESFVTYYKRGLDKQLDDLRKYADKNFEIIFKALTGKL